MNIEKAIEVLGNMMQGQQGAGLTRRIDALKLGIEALEAVEYMRSAPAGTVCDRLAGETQD